LLVNPAALLARSPAPPDAHVRAAGGLLAWLGLGLSGLAATWQAYKARARLGVHLVGALAVGGAVLAACTAARLDPEGWTAYRVLLASGAGLSLALLAAGWARARARTAGDEGALLP